jgi:hypothetical protein
MKLEKLLGFLIPDAADCRAAAAKLRDEHPHLTPQQLAEKAVASSRKLAAGTGAAMGALASPLTWLPAALADAAAVLRIEGRLAGTIAALLDPEVLDQPEEFRADVLSIVFPGLASQALRAAGVRSGLHVTQRLIRSQGAQKLMQSVLRIGSRPVGRRFVEKALLTKAVPLVGAGVGSGWNWLEVHAVGKRAVAYYMHRPIGPRKRGLLARLRGWSHA